MAPKGRPAGKAAAAKGKARGARSSGGRSAGSPSGSQGRAPPSSSDKSIATKRAPLLALWLTVCLERLGYSREAAVTAAKVIAGRGSRAVGRAFGVVQQKQEEATAPRKRPAGVAEEVHIGGNVVKMTETPSGLCALDDRTSKPVDASKAEDYLRRAFQDDFENVQAAMRESAEAQSEDSLRNEAMKVYERFRPGAKFGQAGQLQLGNIRQAAQGGQ